MSGDGIVRGRTRVAFVGVVSMLAAAGALLAPGAGAGTRARGDSIHVRSSRVIAPASHLSAPDGISQFPGETPCLGGLCSTPGEPVVAVGASDVLQTSNTAATVYGKTGTKLAEFDFYKSFWGEEVEDCGDVRTIYIPSVERFAMSCGDASGSEGNPPMRFAISKTNDPTGEWFKYAAPPPVQDQPKIEATTNKFVIAGNFSSNEPMYVYNLSELVAGAAKPTVVTLTATKSNIYMAAVQQTQTANAYFVSAFPGNKLYLATITGTPAESNVKLTETAITIKDFPAPHEPSVPGGQIGGEKMDGRVYDAIYETETSDSHAVIAFSSARECGTHTCLARGKLDLSGTKPVLKEWVLIGEPGFDYTYGGIGLNAKGTPFEVYSRSSAGEDPGTAVVGPGYDVMLQAATPGVSTCEESQTPPCNIRWGDYIGTAIDPGEPESVWVTGLYLGADGPYGWRTVVSKVSPTSFTLPSATTGASSSVKASSATLAGSVNPNGIATKYHIDYGLTSGYEHATAEVSAGSGTSPVPVSASVTGLEAGMTYHFRVVATTSTGNAVGADKTFKTAKPKITSVTFTGTPAEPTVTINGSNFGTEPAASGPVTCFEGDNSFDYGTALEFTDTNGVWTAGEEGDCIGLLISAYNEKQIVYKFGAAGYSHYPQVTSGDAYKLKVYSVTHSGTVAYT